MNTGDRVMFGGYEWRVLDIQDGSALVITEDIIEKRPYHDRYQDITWAGCSLRAHLNGAFYDGFSAADRERIMPVINKNADNPWFGTQGGPDTQDSVFLLDIEDTVCRYFGDSSSHLINRSEKQNYWFQKKDVNNAERAAVFKGFGYWWWLRSPGRVPRTAAYIHGNPAGCVGLNGNSVFFNRFGPERDGGVRPAMRIRL